MPVAIITGASKGLGRALAEALAARGWDLVLDARTAEVLQETVAGLRTYGTRVTAFPGDVTDAGHPSEPVAAAWQRRAWEIAGRRRRWPVEHRALVPTNRSARDMAEHRARKPTSPRPRKIAKRGVRKPPQPQPRKRAKQGVRKPPQPQPRKRAKQRARKPAKPQPRKTTEPGFSG